MSDTFLEHTYSYYVSKKIKTFNIRAKLHCIEFLYGSGNCALVLIMSLTVYSISIKATKNIYRDIYKLFVQLISIHTTVSGL